MNTPSDIASDSSIDHVMSTEPITTDNEDTMPTTSDMIDVTQTENNDIRETTEPDSLMTTAVEATTQPISDREDTVSTTIDMIQTDSTDIGETTELDDSLIATAVEATTQSISTDREDTTNGGVMQTDSTDTAETTEDDSPMEEVQTTEVDVTQLEVSVTEDVDDGSSFTADGESERLGADSGEVFAPAGAMVISPIVGLVMALAIAIADLNL